MGRPYSEAPGWALDPTSGHDPLAQVLLYSKHPAGNRTLLARNFRATAVRVLRLPRFNYFFAVALRTRLPFGFAGPFFALGLPLEAEPQARALLV